MASPNSGGDDDQMSSALDELGDMIRQQQDLRDRTYRRGQQQHGQRAVSKASRVSKAINNGRWATCSKTRRRCATA